MDAERTPVIVGVGQVNDRPADPAEGMDPVALMAEALRRADDDAGGGWLANCDSLAVVRQIAWPQLDPIDGVVAEALGIAPAHREQTASPNGDSPVRLLNEAANRIGAGHARVCAIVGGEALRTANQRLAALPRGDGDRPNALRDSPHRARTGYAQDHGLVLPVDVYPLYENAIRHRLGQTLAEGQAETAAMWALMSEVAAGTPEAWIGEAVTPEAVITPGISNRPIAFPYTKLQVANASVNQGAAFLVTSLAEARRRGVAEDRLVYVGHGAAAHESENFLERDSYAASPSLAVSIERCLAMNGVTAADLAHVELYSCFPCVPKLARRVLGWPLEKPITVFGGLTFGGGPIGNYMSHAVACMVEKLRATGGTGLLFANGGYATHNHTIVLSADPIGAAFPQDFDCQADADARRGPIPPLDEDYTGPATLETWTVHFDRTGEPWLGTVVAQTPYGSRTLAVVPAQDRASLKRLLDVAVEPISHPGSIFLGLAGNRLWRFGTEPGSPI